jgi:hypothetical protein
MSRAEALNWACGKEALGWVARYAGGEWKAAAGFDFREKIELYERARMTREGVDEGSIRRFEVLSGGGGLSLYHVIKSIGNISCFLIVAIMTLIVSVAVLNWKAGIAAMLTCVLTLFASWRIYKTYLLMMEK